MKNLLLTCVVLLSTNMTVAQDYFPMPTESTTWSIIRTQTDPGPMDPSFLGVWHHSIVADTLVNNTLYHQVKISNGGDEFNLANSYGNFVYREDGNKRIWGIDDDEEFLMFDFNLNEGDTFCFDLQPSGVLCHEVVLVDSVEIGGEFRRQIHFEHEGLQDIWVEGIGSLIYGITGFWSFIGNFQDDLLCITQSDQQVYGSCDFPTGVSEFVGRSISIKPYPNPSESIIQFDFDNDDLHTMDIMIYNLIGELVFSETYLNSNFELDVSNFEKGFYTVVIQEHNGYSYVSKFCKE